MVVEQQCWVIFCHYDDIAFLTFRDSALAVKAISLCRALSEKLVNCYDDDVGVHMLRPLSESLPHILIHVPDANVESVTNFDNKPTASGKQKKPAYLRPLPPINRRRAITSEPDNFEDFSLLFAEGRK
ncbi:hypothetical protein KIN20_019954 [Parelaphostrongylus tenuis]|uniref:Uncharacterized protein n=1 Tax=Parelaphostrongylus tenuis TaxID=148309 RepID=A0AAD5MLS9_PARTN|nr:hypothetical protein KIN20_019954 [Parelaphostrongylus tenuis]